jgi:hypothetical protein
LCIKITKTISINRAPVLTISAAVVAERLGFEEDEALTLGRAVAGLNAQSKGRRLGIFKPQEEKAKKAREKEPGERFYVEVCGRAAPARNTADGVRAVQRGKEIDPESVKRYLKGKFGEDLRAARSAMKKLSRAYRPRELAGHGLPRNRPHPRHGTLHYLLMPDERQQSSGRKGPQAAAPLPGLPAQVVLELAGRAGGVLDETEHLLRAEWL